MGEQAGMPGGKREIERGKRDSERERERERERAGRDCKKMVVVMH